MQVSDIVFKRDNLSFTHNLNHDFGCFALWKTARPYVDQIRELLELHFEILLETEIEWSEKHFHANAARLYEEPIIYNNINKNARSSHAKKIGDTKFILFVIKDSNPDYTYAKSVSGKIEFSNLNIVKAKYQIRDWIYDDLKIKYAVHSTNNIFEFFYQAPLLLGIDLFEKLLNGDKLNLDKITKDLEGAGGWKNYEELFEILNITTNYLVLRGFETLPYSNPERDLDLLTDNYQLLASALGLEQLENRLYKGKLWINNEQINIDVRFVGDKYYDTTWAKEMLETKVLQNNVIFTPRIDHYFFSLLFHAKVQKPQVKEKYKEIFRIVANNLNFYWFNVNMLEDNNKIGQILRGYFQSHSYYYEHPLDKGVFKNFEIINHLPSTASFSVSFKQQNLFFRIARKVIPSKFVPFLKRYIIK